MRRYARIRAARTDERGGALVVALIALTTTALITSSLLQVSSAVTQRQTSEVANMRAFYLAEAGLSEAYDSLRMGRTGQIGSAAVPAVYGDGLLWVDVTPVDDMRVRLESKAVYGRGTSTLDLVVERVELPLGVFSDEDLVLPPAIIADGFDSTEGDYLEQTGLDKVVIDPGKEIQFWPDYHIVRYDETFYLYSEAYYDANLEKRVFHWINSVPASEVQAYTGDQATEKEVVMKLLDYYSYYELPDLARTTDPIAIDNTVPMDSDLAFGTGGMFIDSGDTMLDPNAGASSSLDGALTSDTGSLDGTASTQDTSLVEFHTTGGALLGSNGDVVVSGGGSPSIVYGDIVPGPEGTVVIEDGGYVSGDTEARQETVELPPVEVPEVELSEAVHYVDAFPMVVSPGTSGFESIEVAEYAELVIRGPATVVIGALRLEAGAQLTLDTRDGDVELYVTGTLDFAPGALVDTPGRSPGDLTVQVSAVDSLGEATVQLNAESQFYGSIYAPQAGVHVGEPFEVFGSVVAKVLDLEPGARLHYDGEGGDAMPRILSWRIVETPAPARALVRNPYATLGLTESDLPLIADAHDLTGVRLDLTYIHKDGRRLDFVGLEADFDWNDVAEIVDSNRGYDWDAWWESWDWADWWDWWDWSNWDDWGGGAQGMAQTSSGRVKGSGTQSQFSW